jgi:cell division protease FtsH
MLGPSLKSKIVTDEQKKLTAYHEAGHALVATVLPQAKKVQKVTIIPRGRAAGYTFSDSGEQDPMTRKRSEFTSEISVLFGGYVVEQEIYNEVTTGAANDLSKATEIAKDMVMRFGMSDLGPIAYQEEKHVAFLGKEMTERDKQYSESSAEMIDKEVRKILDECYKTTQEIIRKFKKELELVTDTLLEKEVLEYEEFNELVKHIANPPFPDPKTATAVISD